MAQSSITGTKISALPAARTLTGSEIMVVVQDGADRRSTAGAVANRAPSQVPSAAELLGSTGSSFTGITTGAGVTLINSTLSGVPAVTIEASTAHTLSDDDRGKTLVSTNSSPVTLTVPAGLTHPYQLTIVQYGAGGITPVADGVTLGNWAGDTQTAGFRAVAALISVAPDLYVFSGNTAP